MKKMVLFTMAVIFVFGLAACGEAQQNQDATTPAVPSPSQSLSDFSSPAVTPLPTVAAEYVTPLQLFDAGYNPCAHIVWPDGYNPYQAACETGEFHLYRLYLTVHDNAENTVTYFSNLAGDNAQESIRQNLDSLNGSGQVTIFGTQTEGGLDADISIRPTDPGNEDYDYLEGFAVSIVFSLDEASASVYQAALDTGFNESAAVVMESYFDLPDAAESFVSVNRDRGFVESSRTYRPDDYASLKQAVSLDDDWLQGDNGDSAAAEYGNMSIILNFDDHSETLYLTERLDNVSTTMADYVPEPSLKNLGFALYDTNCAYRDDQVWIGVYKQEWGDTNNDIKCSFTIFGQPCFIVISYPEQLYSVGIGPDEHRISYSYDPFTGTVTPEKRYETYDDFKSAFREMTGQTSDLSVTQPAAFVDDTLLALFAYKPEALFTLPRQ